MSGVYLLLLILIPMISAPLCYFVSKSSLMSGRCIYFIASSADILLSALVLLSVIRGESISFDCNRICGLGIHLTADGFRAVHFLIAAFIWISASCFDLFYSKNDSRTQKSRMMLFLMITLSAVNGVFASEDLFTTFVFFEIMSFASFVWVIHDESDHSMSAGKLYLKVSVIAGMIMLMGLFLLWDKFGTLEFSELASVVTLNDPAVFISGVLILVGFGAKAGMYPLHIWLPDSYSSAPASTTTLLSSVLSKTGIFGILILCIYVFRGNELWSYLILVLGILTMLWGGILGIFSDDLKRIFACSSMSQIGFILVGTSMIGFLGEENGIAVAGTVLHMINHSVLKLVLFSLAGVVFIKFGTCKLNKIKGFGRDKALFAFAFILAALGISGVPLFNGYISKTLIHEAIVECSGLMSGNAAFFINCAEWIFLISGGLTVAYMLKAFVALFIDKPDASQERSAFWAKFMPLLFVIPLLFIITIGLFPNFCAESIAKFCAGIDPNAVFFGGIDYFSIENIKGALISLGIGVFVYFFVVRCFMFNKNTGEYKTFGTGMSLDKSVFYPVVMKFVPFILGKISVFLDRYIVDYVFKFIMRFFGWICEILNMLVDSAVKLLKKTIYKPVKTEDKEHVALTYRAGNVLDLINHIRNRIHGKNQESHYAEKIENLEEQSYVRRRMISASLSYGLLLFGCGLVIVLLYLLFA